MVHARGMAPLPTPVRAALGLAAVTVEQARTLPDRTLELPVLVVSTALQFSVRVQQRYAELALRGDELLGRLHAPPEEPPAWATFDDEEPEPEPAADSASADTGAAKPARRRTEAARPPTHAEPSPFDATGAPSDTDKPKPSRRRAEAASPPARAEAAPVDNTPE